MALTNNGDASYSPNRAWWDAYAVSPRVGAIGAARALAAIPLARSLSPRSSEATRAHFRDRFGPRDDERHYADSFRAETGLTVLPRGGPRAVGELVNDNADSLLVEVGSGTTRGHHVMARVRAALRDGTR